MTAARAKMLEYSIEVEEKIASCTADIGAVPVVLVFCGDEFKWHLDSLEDFVDFYRTGRYRYDDPFSKMAAHYISEKSITQQPNKIDWAYISHLNYLKATGQVPVLRFTVSVELPKRDSKRKVG
jgi:hypothetical protein